MGNNYENFEELPDEFLENWQEDIPDVHWAENIAKIQDPEIRQREIDAANEILEKQQAVNEKHKSGEMNDYHFWEANTFDLRQEKTKASTRSALASEGLSFDMLGDIAEDWDFVSADKQKMMGLKDDLKKTIRRLGPGPAQELANKQLAEGKLSDEAYKMISRQVRLYKK
ncbi:uncharacterized protein Dvar_51290 [Desulfosarcina variabilis str. Montpellier]|uniref:hypothetical protein n=1 Tax=Desulfosarcina variabilis TaxID=2300 RepID=UPI003AFA4692